MTWLYLLHTAVQQGRNKPNVTCLCRTQDEPAFCGLASLAMVLNALAVDPRRPWKGPWRWFHEQMLDCCRPLSEVIQTGVILDQVRFALFIVTALVSYNMNTAEYIWTAIASLLMCALPKSALFPKTTKQFLDMVLCLALYPSPVESYAQHRQ